MTAKQIPTPEDAEAQHWGQLDGAVAYHLIERHADSWDHAARMMNAWRDAAVKKAVAAERDACAQLVVDTKEWRGKGWTSNICPVTKEAIASAIRARGAA